MKKIALALTLLALASCSGSAAKEQISSFEECIAAGNPVMESYPEQCRTQDGRFFVRNIGNRNELANLIQVFSPLPGDTLGEEITGEARGYWFFEANFPVTIKDANGNVLLETYAEAQSDWMTEEFVPFTVEVPSVLSSRTKTGTISLKKANPSGLPENDKTLRIPVEFE